MKVWRCEGCGKVWPARWFMALRYHDELGFALGGLSHFPHSPRVIDSYDYGSTRHCGYLTLGRHSE